MVFVFIWLPKLLDGNIGHGSMQVGGSYISNWPGSLSSVFYRGPGKAAENLDSDVASEGGMPNLIFQLRDMNEDDMEDKWNELKKNLVYSFELRNCFETVAQVLSEGLSFTQSLLVPIPESSVLVHAMLVTYVHNISLAMGNGIPTNMMTNQNVFKQAWERAKSTF